MARFMKARFRSECYGCGEHIEKNQDMYWYGKGEGYHVGCEPRGGVLKENSDPFGHLFEHPLPLPEGAEAYHASIENGKVVHECNGECFRGSTHDTN